MNFQEILKELPVDVYTRVNSKMPEYLGISQRTWQRQKKKPITLNPGGITGALAYLFSLTDKQGKPYFSKETFFNSLFAELNNDINKASNQN